ncbi:MAG: hypothetical protein LRY71_16700 [Bacillaceae bacterium]|nr:hypothetical protein [Bacillaceae bacterium]
MFFLEGAKQGKFGGKEYKTNMYQVNKAKVVQYANNYLSKRSEYEDGVQQTLFDVNSVKVKRVSNDREEEIYSIIKFEEQGVLKKEAAYDAIKKIMSAANVSTKM